MHTYFPLRSNAHGLVAGTPAAAVVRRIKTAALLGDVLIEDGVYRLDAGPSGSAGFWSPGQQDDAESWQSARDRGIAQSVGFAVTMSSTGTGAAAIPLASSESTISWRSSFLPLKRQLSRAYPWLNFVPVCLNEAGKKAARELMTTDDRAGAIAREPLRFVRAKVLQHVSIDTVASVGLRAAVSMDGRHAAVAAARVAAGRGTTVLEAEALHLLVPDVGALGWDEIDRLRRERGWDTLRKLWAEIGEFASDPGLSQRKVVRLVNDEYKDRLREAAAAAEGPRGATRWAGTVLGLALGALPTLAGLPLLPGLAAGALATGIGVAIDITQKQPSDRWVSADQALHDAVLRRLAREDG